jgi:hypothetical protein
VHDTGIAIDPGGKSSRHHLRKRRKPLLDIYLLLPVLLSYVIENNVVIT